MKKNSGLVVVLSLIITIIYVLINNYFIINLYEVLNYIFVFIIFLVSFNTIKQLFNDKYNNFNRKYLSFFSKLRLVNAYTSDGAMLLSHQQMDGQIKEGNKYSFGNKFLFLSIKFGIILLLTLIWHVLLGNNSILLNDLSIIILMLLIITCLIIVPIIVPIVSLNIKK